MPVLRFIHASDLHLDSPFSGLRAFAPDNVHSNLRRATFDAYDNIVDLCIKERVNALLIAGDIYDGVDRSLRAQLKFVDGLKRLDAAGIRSFVCHGNHDPLDGWEAKLDLPGNCVRFGSEIKGEPVFPDDPERATVYGLSYPRREVRENLSPHFLNLPKVGFSIGLLHANVDGDPNHDSYAACSVSDLEKTGIDYWALGHVHTRSVLRRSDPCIAYPGNPQGRHPNELGTRGVYLVEVDESGAVELEFRPVDTVRWERLDLSIGRLENDQQVLNAISDMAASALEGAEGRCVVLRLVLSGRGPTDSWLRRPGTVEDLMEELNEEYAGNSPWLWCERIQIETESSIDREQIRGREDFAGDLARLVQDLEQDPTALEELRQSLGQLYESPRARRYLRELPGDDELKSILADAEEECLAELAAERYGT